MLRVFVGVELSPEVRENLAVLQQQLKKILPSMHWVRPESIHLTLKFLGYVEPVRISDLRSALESIGKTQQAFSIDIQGMGVFPHLRHPRILWVGVNGQTRLLQELVLEIESELEPLGFPVEEKSYHPHLTVARIKHENALVGSALMESGVLKSAQSLGILTIDRFILFQSDLDSSGAIYTPLGTVHLSGKTQEP